MTSAGGIDTRLDASKCFNTSHGLLLGYARVDPTMTPLSKRTEQATSADFYGDYWSLTTPPGTWPPEYLGGPQPPPGAFAVYWNSLPLDEAYVTNNATKQRLFGVSVSPNEPKAPASAALT